jgi:hypothetical protein
VPIDGGAPRIYQPVTASAGERLSSGRLQCENFARRVAKLELVGQRTNASDALHGSEHIIELVAQCDPAKRHPALVRENLYAASMLDAMIQLGGHPRGELMIGAWLSLDPDARALPRFASGICKKKRGPDSQARYQSDLSSPIGRHLSVTLGLASMVGGRQSRPLNNP